MHTALGDHMISVMCTAVHEAQSVTSEVCVCIVKVWWVCYLQPWGLFDDNRHVYCE